MPGLKVKTAPTEEPVSLDEAKLHLRVDHTEEDTLIAQCIAAAARWAEDRAGVSLTTRVLQLALDAFPIPGDRGYPAILLPAPPIDEAEDVTVTYVDSAGANQTLSAADYVLDAFACPATLRPAYGKSWPTARAQPNAVTVEWTAGAAQADVDPRAKHAILMIVGDLYANREGVIIGTISKHIEHGAMDLLHQLWPGRLE